jgi:hypothetical protein
LDSVCPTPHEIERSHGFGAVVIRRMQRPSNIVAGEVAWMIVIAHYYLLLFGDVNQPSPRCLAQNPKSGG